MIPAAPITSALGARQYLRALHAAGRLYHPEERAADMIAFATGAPLFTASEAVAAEARMAEVYLHLSDPCAVVLDLLTGRGHAITVRRRGGGSDHEAIRRARAEGGVE